MQIVVCGLKQIVTCLGRKYELYKTAKNVKRQKTHPYIFKTAIFCVFAAAGNSNRIVHLL